jgi:hypothetical protein
MLPTSVALTDVQRFASKEVLNFQLKKNIFN